MFSHAFLLILLIGRQQFHIDFDRGGYAPSNMIRTHCFREYDNKDYLQRHAEMWNSVVCILFWKGKSGRGVCVWEGGGVG